MNPVIKLHKKDIPADIELGKLLSIDGEFLGLNVQRDPLCLIQISSGNSDAHIIQLDRSNYDAPNLKKLLSDKTITKILVTYYHNKNTPKWGYVTISGKPVYDHSSSTQFVLSQRCHGELVTKILEYLGVSIREAEVVQYTQNKEAIQDN